MTTSTAIQHHLLSVSDYYRLHIRPKATEEIQPLLIASISIDWQGLFSY